MIKALKALWRNRSDTAAASQSPQAVEDIHPADELPGCASNGDRRSNAAKQHGKRGASARNKRPSKPTQADEVFVLMMDNEWRTLAEIEAALGYGQSSISARLRDLRKPEFGEHKVERRRLKDGRWAYRLLHT